MTAEPIWLSKLAILTLHDRSIALHGGAGGLRDDGLLDSPLMRPQNRFFYEDVSDLHALAATYAGAMSANHPFVDGNQRAAFLSATLFLRLNGLRLTASQADAAQTTLSLAAGAISVAEMQAWLASKTAPTDR